MRGHCACKAPESIPGRHDTSGKLMETRLGAAAPHKVLDLLLLGGGTMTSEPGGKFRNRTCLSSKRRDFWHT